jgi:hypothetical protein
LSLAAGSGCGTWEAMAVILKPIIITPRIEEVLRAVHFYRYMTALDITYLMFSPGAITHVRDILRLLCGGNDYAENQYLYRFPIPHLTAGKTEKVFTLGSRGRDFLTKEGLTVNWYFRPQHTRHLTHGLITHNLTLTRFLVACHVWTRRSEFTIKNIRICYELSKLGIKVIPDAWIHFMRGTTNCPILIEVDNGTAYKDRFKEHIKSRVEFLRSGDYQKVFMSRGCMIAYITTGEVKEYKNSRVRFMVDCAKEALKDLKLESWASILRFTAVERKNLFDTDLFDGRVWMRPDTDSLVSLLHD